MPKQLKADGVFEGGGVKGIGLVGAYEVVEKKGYVMQNLAGTSAGAIVAALIAAGYKAARLKQIMRGLDYKKFMDKGLVDRIPIIGPVLSVAFEKGVYEGKWFQDWLSGLLLRAPRKPVRTFKDLVVGDHKFSRDPRYRYRLQVIAADLTRNRMLVLPGDIKHYGMNPDDLDVAWAVRMSMSIPYFFEPVELKDSRGTKSFVVDGGMLSNFPVWLFDDDKSPGGPAWPTFGFKLVEPQEGKPRKIRGPVSMAFAMLGTMMGAHDARYIEESDFVRTIPIPTGRVSATDFGLSKQTADWLYRSGRQAAEKFFNRWDFEAYAKKYRGARKLKPRSERIWKD